MAFAGILGAAVGAGGDIGGKFLNAYLNKKQQKYAYELSRRFRATAAEDLRKQGINPILAAGPGPQGGAFGAGTVGESSVGSSAVSSALRAAEARRTSKRVDAELDNLKSNTRLQWRQSQLANASREKTDWESIESIWRGELLKAQKEGQDVTNTLLATEVPSAKAAEEFYRKYPVARQVRALLESIGRATARGR